MYFRSVGCACVYGYITVVYQFDSLPSLCYRLPGSLVTEGERKGEKTLDVSDANGEPMCTTCKNFASYPDICHTQYQCHSQTFSLMFQLKPGDEANTVLMLGEQVTDIWTRRLSYKELDLVHNQAFAFQVSGKQ